MERLGLSLSGGGARGAYQAGVIQAVVEIAGDRSREKLFPIISGLSAGSLNGVFLAAGSHDLPGTALKLRELWSEVRTEKIFKTNPFSLGRTGLRWFRQLAFGGVRGAGGKKNARSLLDTAPLRDLLSEIIDYAKIQENLQNGHLDSLSVTATDYGTGYGITFVHSREPVVPWNRIRRMGIPAPITVDHLMASSSIPLLFPPVKLGDRYYGDGGLRNTAPLSPAIHMGARKLLIVGVKRQLDTPPNLDEQPESQPTLGRILSVMINGILMDAIDLDVERLDRINGTLEMLKDKSKVSLRPVDYLWIHPSKDLAQIACRWVHEIPASLRYLVAGLGTKEESSDLISYLLFEKGYCGELLDLGYSDAMNQKEQILQFIAK